MASPTRILIVDDEPDILLMMRVNLEGEGFETVLAADGETALARIAADHPALVLLDVMMPVLDGWGVLESLRSLPDPPAVIVVSAKAAPGDLARAYELGAADYVTKPFSIDALLETIRQVLERTEAEQSEYRSAALARLQDDQTAAMPPGD